jgi:hypothetical protein
MQFIVYTMGKDYSYVGPVGTRIVVNAWGFRVGEDGITLTFDDEIMVYNINANDQGAVIDDSDSRIGDTTERPYVIVPPSPQGIHKVGIFGSSFTPKGTYADMDFIVVPDIEIEPASGKQGSQATIKGYGFAMNDVVTVRF